MLKTGIVWQEKTKKVGVIKVVFFDLQRFFFMSTNKMAEIVDSGAASVDTFVPEARLDDNDRRKLIAFYKKKRILWDTSLKLSKKAAKEQNETALKDLEEHFDWHVC